MRISIFSIIALSLFVSFVSKLQAQDIIRKTDERIIAAKVILIDSTHIHYKEYTNLNGPTLKIAREDVSKIDFDYASKNSNLVKQTVAYQRPKNAVSIGLMGTSGVISVNYDRVLLEDKNWFLSGKLGFGSMLAQSNVATHLSYNYNFGKHKHYIELGIGAAVGLNQFHQYYRYYVSAPMIGYRLQASEKFFLRANLQGLAMLQDSWGDNVIIPFLGIDLGFAF